MKSQVDRQRSLLLSRGDDSSASVKCDEDLIASLRCRVLDGERECDVLRECLSNVSRCVGVLDGRDRDPSLDAVSLGANLQERVRSLEVRPTSVSSGDCESGLEAIQSDVRDSLDDSSKISCLEKHVIDLIQNKSDIYLS